MIVGSPCDLDDQSGHNRGTNKGPTLMGVGVSLVLEPRWSTLWATSVVAKGTEASWNRKTKTATCAICLGAPEVATATAADAIIRRIEAPIVRQVNRRIGATFASCEHLRVPSGRLPGWCRCSSSRDPKRCHDPDNGCPCRVMCPGEEAGAGLAPARWPDQKPVRLRGALCSLVGAVAGGTLGY